MEKILITFVVVKFKEEDKRSDRQRGTSDTIKIKEWKLDSILKCEFSPFVTAALLAVVIKFFVCIARLQLGF